jgi:membrane-bound lytic murein transglycosylase D
VPDLASLRWYTVKRGETLPLIARKLRVGKADLADANYLKGTARVNTGQKLMVPHEATGLMAARTERSVPVAEARTIVAEPVRLATAANSDRVKTTYQVKRGDTLASIARIFKTTVASLQRWNKLPGSHIVPGERLTIYPPSAVRLTD